MAACGALAAATARAAHRGIHCPEWPTISNFRALTQRSCNGSPNWVGLWGAMCASSIDGAPRYRDVKQAIANKIIELGKTGERNPDVLCERALKTFANRQDRRGDAFSLRLRRYAQR
jgi:hypothetical protein